MSSDCLLPNDQKPDATHKVIFLQSSICRHIELHHLCHRLFTKLQCPSLLPAYRNLSCSSVVKNPPAAQETQETGVQSLGQEDPLEKEMATCSSTLAWKTPWVEEPGRLQSKRVIRSWTWLSLQASQRKVEGCWPPARVTQMWVETGIQGASVCDIYH